MHLTTAATNAEPALDQTPSVHVARRELASLITTSLGLVVVAQLLDRSSLARRGPWGELASWTYGSPAVASLRVLRVALQFGSAALLLWLTLLATLCLPRRTARSAVIARLPFGSIVRRALIGTMALAVVSPAGNPAFAASRPAVVANDATGGQRWPDLTPSTTAQPSTVRMSSAPPTSVAATSTAPPTLPPLAPRSPDTTPTIPLRQPPRTTGPAAPQRTVSIRPETAGPRIIEDAPPVAAGPAVAMFTTNGRGSGEQPDDRTRTVQAGESFWSIAEDEILINIDEATEADVVEYWGRLIERNQARLPDPRNPDLLWVDTVIDLPPTSASRIGPSTPK